MEQRKRKLLAGACSQAEQPFLRQMTEDVDTALAHRGDAVRLEQRKHGLPRQLLAALQSCLANLPAAGEGGFIDVELPAPACALGEPAWGQQVEHPACVRSGYEVQGPTHRPCTYDGAGVECLLDNSFCAAG